MAPPTLAGSTSASLTPDLVKAHDALVIVGPAPIATQASVLGRELAAALETAVAADASLLRPHAPVVVAVPGAPGGRAVFASTIALTDDLDDVRAIAEATVAATNRAVSAGATRPLLSIHAPTGTRFAHALEVAALAALGSQWLPLEGREAASREGREGKGKKPIVLPRTAERITVLGLSSARASILSALELGRYLCRDIGGTEPERMAPRRVAELCEQAFAGTAVTVKVEHDVTGYPLLSAVARASMRVERHRPCVIRLEYKPQGSIERTIILCGKGVTYDTGGADLKTDGHMAGMSRDKGGAAAVAGLLRAVAELQPRGVRVIGLLGMVRNSIGDESFVSDEIIESRAGVRVRIGNTDAEGRLVLADLLAEARELASGEPAPLLVSLATLTGHVYRAYGPYTGAIGNARAGGDLEVIDALAEQWGEPMERSRPRREDYAFIAARSSAEDVVSCNRAASVNTARGHQFPFAFLDVTAAIRGTDLPFIHLDIGGSAVEPADWQFGRPTGTPILTLAAFLARNQT
jgi:leucyl aminopeptidase